ncbi:hypothetical protein GF407_09750 [candidate division KSB1 bacterium]|nr:hypothetical protein [candidate division KSB1 bacterium]
MDQIDRNYSTGLKNLLQSLSVRADSQHINIINLDSSSALNWFFEKTTVRVLTDIGFERIYQTDSVEQPMYHLHFKPVDCTVGYKTDSDSVIRRIKTSVYLKLMNPQKRILYSDVLSDTLSDVIAKSTIPDIEDDNLPFTKGSGISKSTFGYLEPILISVLTAGIIYTFYSYRSQ